MSNQYDSYINAAAEKYNVDPKLVKAIIQQESGFNPNARSSAGAGGLMQLMPGTARGLGVTDVYNPQQNIEAGTRYISNLLKQYNGDTKLALAAYNAGSGNVAKYGGIPPFKETQNYVNKVLSNYKGVSVSGGTTGSSQDNNDKGNMVSRYFNGITRVVLVALFFILALVFFIKTFPAMGNGVKSLSKLSPVGRVLK